MGVRGRWRTTSVHDDRNGCLPFLIAVGSAQQEETTSYWWQLTSTAECVQSICLTVSIAGTTLINRSFQSDGVQDG